MTHRKKEAVMLLSAIALGSLMTTAALAKGGNGNGHRPSSGSTETTTETTSHGHGNGHGNAHGNRPSSGSTETTETTETTSHGNGHGNAHGNAHGNRPSSSSTETTTQTTPAPTPTSLTPEQQQQLINLIRGNGEHSDLINGQMRSDILANLTSLPPGIQQQLLRGRGLPPGIAKKFTLPQSVNSQLNLPQNAQLMVLGSNIVVMDPVTSVINQVLPNVLQSLAQAVH